MNIENVIIAIIFIVAFTYQHNFIIFHIRQLYNNDIQQYSVYCNKVNVLIDKIDRQGAHINKLEKSNKLKLTKMTQIYDAACASKIKNEKKIFNKTKYKIITMSIHDQIDILETKAKEIIEQNYDAIILYHIKNIKFKNT